jgi:hypothetical protein
LVWGFGVSKNGLQVTQKPPGPAPSRLVQSLTERAAPVNSPTIRRGEGHKVAVNRIGRNTGSGTTTFGLDFSEVPVPPRRYTADVCDVSLKRGSILLIFGQEASFGTCLDSAFQVRMNPTATTDFLRSMVQMDGRSIDEVLALLGLPAEPLTQITEKPVREAKAIATFASVAVSGFDTCIDFYNASPFAYKHLADTGELYVEPIARVDITTALFSSMLERLKELVAQLPETKKEGSK